MFIFNNGELVTKLEWSAPTKNTDGTDITYALTYRVYVDGVAVLVTPGTLNPEGRYEVPLEDVGVLNEERVYDIFLTAVEVGNATRGESGPSNTIQIARIPAPPLAPADLSAA